MPLYISVTKKHKTPNIHTDIRTDTSFFWKAYIYFSTAFDYIDLYIYQYWYSHPCIVPSHVLYKLAYMTNRIQQKLWHLVLRFGYKTYHGSVSLYLNCDCIYLCLWLVTHSMVSWLPFSWGQQLGSLGEAHKGRNCQSVTSKSCQKPHNWAEGRFSSSWVFSWLQPWLTAWLKFHERFGARSTQLSYSLIPDPQNIGDNKCLFF